WQDTWVSDELEGLAARGRAIFERLRAGPESPQPSVEPSTSDAESAAAPPLPSSPPPPPADERERESAAVADEPAELPKLDVPGLAEAAGAIVEEELP